MPKDKNPSPVRIIEVSDATYTEIKTALEQQGFSPAIMDDVNQRQLMMLYGVALRARERPKL